MEHIHREIQRDRALILHSTATGAGGPVILLHGMFGMGDNLSMVARPLSEHFEVHRLDLRNHGRSFRDKSMSFPEMADDVLRWMDHQGITRAHLLGHSLGGKVAMQVALQQPQRVERLVVADIAPVAYQGNHDAVFAGLNAVIPRAVASRREAETVLKEFVEEPGVRLFLLKSLYRNEQGEFAWRMNVEGLRDNYGELCKANTTQAPFTGPTLFIKGENSNYIRMEYRDEIEQLFPAAQFKIIQNTGHWLHAEKPAAFNHLVNKFLLED